MTLQPYNLTTLKLQNLKKTLTKIPQTLKPSNPQTLKPSNP